MSIRVFAVAVLCLAVFAMVTSATAEQVEITVLEHVLEGHEPVEIIAEFEALYPNIKITMVDGPTMNAQETITTWLLGGTAPDLFVGWRTSPVEWARGGFLLDLTPYIERYMTAEDIAEYAPAQYAYINLDGKQYGIPKYLGTVATYYNRRLFSEAGIPEPTRDTWTWDTLRSAAIKLTVRDGVDVTRYGFFTLYAYDRLDYWIRQGGGFIQDPHDPNKVAVDRPEAMRALEFLYQLAYEDEVYLIDWWPAVPKFGGEQLAIWEEGVWSLKGIVETGVDVGICELARGPGGRASMVSNDVYVINSQTKHPEEAFLFLKFIASPYAAAIRAETGMVPATRSAAGSWIEYAVEEYRLPPTYLMSFINASEYAYPAPIFKNQTLVDEYFQEITDRIFYFGEPPAAVINSVVPALNAALRE